jgi:hypothetical protein
MDESTSYPLYRITTKDGKTYLARLKMGVYWAAYDLKGLNSRAVFAQSQVVEAVKIGDS